MNTDGSWGGESGTGKKKNMIWYRPTLPTSDACHAVPYIRTWACQDQANVNCYNTHLGSDKEVITGRWEPSSSSWPSKNICQSTTRCGNPYHSVEKVKPLVGEPCGGYWFCFPLWKGSTWLTLLFCEYFCGKRNKEESLGSTDHKPGMSLHPQSFLNNWPTLYIKVLR